jgi:hypothetical protein
MALSRTERPMTFRESLPPDKRHLAWMPTQTVLLTLPDDLGRYTAFQVRYCPLTRELAHNVARYQREGGDETGEEG